MKMNKSKGGRDGRQTDAAQTIFIACPRSSDFFFITPSEVAQAVLWL
jgi:hypothetical protein